MDKGKLSNIKGIRLSSVQFDEYGDNTQTEHEQRMWDHYKSLEDENFHLKKQLDRKNKEIKKLNKLLNRRNHKRRKDQYRNKTQFHGAKK